MTHVFRSTVRPLFSDIPIEKAFAHRKEAVREAIAALTRDVGLLADLPRLRTDLVQTYRLDPLRLQWSARTTEVPPGTADRGAPDSTAAVFVPFTGTPGLFDMTPTRHEGGPPAGFVRYGEPIEGEPIEGELVLAIPVEPVDGGRELGRQQARIDSWVVRSTADVHRFNRELSGFVRAELADLEHRTRRVAELTQARAAARISRDEAGRGTPVLLVDRQARRSSHDADASRAGTSSVA